MQKLKDIVDQVLNEIGIRRAGGVVRDIPQGKIYDKSALPEAQQHAKRFAMTNKTGTANIPPETTPKAVGGKLSRESVRDFLTSEPVATISGSEFTKTEAPITKRVAAWYLETHGGKATSPSIGEVTLDERGVKDSIAHGLGRDKAAAFALVPDIIEKGAILDHCDNWEGRHVEGYVIGAPVEIGGVHHVGIVVVRKSKELQRFYLHEVYLTKGLQQPFKTGAFPSTGGREAGGSGVISKILHGIFNVKPENL
ncbi:MAG: hypothetical protein WCK00_03715 [Deltaproteobacteria bacterium]